jgi:hypothetical protein|tara:strand:+ start:2277 stop:2678 length:402 start_codon:yes stop_codon:yes gene_type:complete
VRSHWKYKKNPNVENMFGFVYVITNKKTKKAYIGCKQYWHYSKTKRTRQTNWKVYMGSSKHLLEDIKKLGKRAFKFEIISEFKNKRSLRYYECYYQMKYNVLATTLEGTDEPAYYNNYVGGKFFRPVQEYKDE